MIALLLNLVFLIYKILYLTQFVATNITCIFNSLQRNVRY